MVEDVTVIDDLVTTAHLCRLFDRSELTIMHWRRYESLPYVRLKGEGRDAIRYKMSPVLRWAKAKGKTLHVAQSDNLVTADAR